MSIQFAQAARVIAGQVSESLNARVLIGDAQGIVVASDRQQQVGLPLHRLLKDWQQALRMPLAVGGRTGEIVIAPAADEVLSPRIARAFVELIISQVDERRPPLEQHSFKNQLIDDLLHDRIRDQALILRQAEELCLDLTLPWAVILIDAERQQRQHILTQTEQFFQSGQELCAALASEQVAVLMPYQPPSPRPTSKRAALQALRQQSQTLLQQLRVTLGKTLTLGLSLQSRHFLNLAESYREASLALRLGQQLQSSNQVYGLDQFGAAAFAYISDPAARSGLARYLLEPLRPDTDLRETLEVFFSENCSPSATAKRLLIHRNTLSYRLDKATLLLALDPRQFEDAVQLRLALLLTRPGQPAGAGDRSLQK